MRVIDCLQIGKANRISLEHIQSVTGLSERAARIEIRRLRTVEKIMVLSTPRADGYWIAANDEWDEVEAFEKMMKAYSSSQKECIQTAQDWKKEHAKPEQLKIENAPVEAATSDKRVG